MDGFEQSGLEKQTDDSQHYQNAIHYKEREKAFTKKKHLSVAYFLLSRL